MRKYLISDIFESSAHQPLAENLKSRRGFTLIELLVVISIISVLSALLMTNFVGVRQRGRDAQRKSDIRQIQTALELYRSDNGSYPISPLPDCGGPFDYGSVTYMQKIPCDPIEKTDYPYISAGGLTYTIYACLENENDADRDLTPQSTCASGVSFTLLNP